MDHEIANTAKVVEEVPRSLFYNRELALVIPHNYSGCKSDAMHSESPPSLHGMTPNEYRSPCCTPEHWVETYRETIENEIEESKNSVNQYESYLEEVYLSNHATDEPQPDLHLAGLFKGRGIDPVYKTSNMLCLIPSRVTINSSFTSTLRTSKGLSKSQASVIFLSTEANYIHHKIAYTVQCTSHTSRNTVFTINGLDKCKCASIRAAEKRISQTKKLLDSFVNSPAFVPHNEEFTINAKVHQIGYALIICNNKPMIVSFKADKSQKTEEVMLLGKHIIWNNNDYLWKKFLDQTRVLSPKYTQEVTPHVTQRTSIRKFTIASYDTLFDVFDILNRKQIQYIKDFDMDDIGRYRINTVPNITRK